MKTSFVALIVATSKITVRICALAVGSDSNVIKLRNCCFYFHADFSDFRRKRSKKAT
jgi:hypothetical protein